MRVLQIVFDSINPSTLSRFYADALHYKLEDPPSGFESRDAFLRSQGIPEEELDNASAIVDPEGRGPRIYFQQPDTPKLGKNRLQIEINASDGMRVALAKRTDQVNAEVERLLRIGAKKLRELSEKGEYCVVMLDPEGNEFCVQ